MYTPRLPLPEFATPGPLVVLAFSAYTYSNWMGNVMFTSVSSSFETALSFLSVAQKLKVLA